MNIVKPYALIHSIDGTSPTHFSGINALKRIEWCGRISHRSEDKQENGTYERFIKAVVLEHGDWSIVEHASATVDFLVDRGITHEIVRHRLMSYTQESTRFVNYEKKMPPSIIWPFPLPMDTTDDVVKDPWIRAMEECEKAYKNLIAKAVPPQIARSVFPNALASRLIATANLRSWRHFFIMRTTKETHPQLREVTIPLLAEFKEKIPLLYDDLEPMARQIDNMRKPK